MRYLVAVSGGIDSVVLLHSLVLAGKHELIVAHFDHGIRLDSADDARFVEGLAAQYKLEYVGTREELGPHASEETARNRRHAFLQHEADKRQATIVTAHHADDVIETIAINATRGTGWRGLTGLNQSIIVRPLLDLTKQQIRTYAQTYRLEWVEDSTNASDMYLRNRLRRRIAAKLDDEQKRALLRLWHTQIALRQEIEREARTFMVENGEYSRYFFSCIDDGSAAEILRMVIARSLTRHQAERALLAIKVAKPGSTIEVGEGTRLFFYERIFVVRTL